MPVEDIAFLNPSFLLEVIPETDKFHVLTLPKSKVATFINNEETIYAYKSPRESRIDSLMSIKRALPVASKTHVVRSGESISTIARKYGVTVNEIKKWNKLKSTKLQRGQRLKVSPPYEQQVQTSVGETGKITEEKTEPTENSSEAEVSNQETGETKVETVKASDAVSYYKVKPGDTLWKIAVNHGMTLDELRKLNGYSKKTVIKPGMKVKVKKK